ncbi:MAG: hypothetical protein ACLUE6_00520 [Acutalibacteraceae bacterium]
MKRTIISLIIVTALVCAFAVGLTACNAEDFEGRLTKAGYEVRGDYVANMEDVTGAIWYLYGFNESTGDVVAIYKAKSLKFAKDIYNELQSEASADGEGYKVERSGRFVFYGTEAAIKAAR